ncbi:MAG: class I SAM-dependent methyltransferase [Candidatus Thermoplasmatota archaeon]|nr:class I SAM-dependent methyltransferase [Candidatus Thermoplasmatota archaeon]
MTQKPYYRDIWCLGTGSGYPGAFPRGLVEKVLHRWNGEKKLMLFSGSFREKGWETVDIKAENRPTYVLNAEQLPEDWTEKYDLVFADPPYSEQEAKSLYDLPYFNIVKVVNEMARVTRAGGYMIFLHRLISRNFPGDTAHFKRMKLSGIVGVFTIAGYSNIRALTVWRKMETLEVQS